jgi:hypothetical protein
MTWWQWLLLVWLALAVIGIPALYIGYGFSMSALAASKKKENPSPRWVIKIDSALVAFFTALDALLNVVVFPFLCLDHRLSMMFRTTTKLGITFLVPELITERLSRYNENPNEWEYRRDHARFFAPLLDAKDPKGWHLRQRPMP